MYFYEYYSFRNALSGEGFAMPRLEKTIVPRIRKSLQTNGLSATIWRCALGPYTLLRHYLKNRKSYVTYKARDEFDELHGIETAKRVHLTDLKIDSPNWIYADGYWPTPPDVFQDALSGLNSRHENLTFIDFGSGKGRVLLMASEFPFRKIVGVEFSSELHAIAEQNILRYKSATQRCRDVTSACTDFTQFPIPIDPLFVFLYNPSSREITSALADNIAQSMRQHPRELWVFYVTPAYDVFESGKPLALRKIKSHPKYAVYTNLPESPQQPL
jgi:SAM-dependent methyltransferase